MCLIHRKDLNKFKFRAKYKYITSLLLSNNDIQIMLKCSESPKTNTSLEVTTINNRLLKLLDYCLY